MAHQRGARPSPRHRLAAAMPHRATTPAPAQMLWNPAQLSMWLNDQDGDCVTAEEAFAKACNDPEIFITDDTVKAWATAAGFLNGANLIEVLDAMQVNGFQQDGKTYNDGKPNSVDWTDRTILTNAISQGPVKIAVAADQLENTVQGVTGFPIKGWYAIGYSDDSNLDHCVSLCGYGTIAWLAEQFNVPVPSGVGDPTAFAYALFTWNSIGIIDEPSMLAITGEAWLRNPTTVIA